MGFLRHTFLHFSAVLITVLITSPDISARQPDAKSPVSSFKIVRDGGHTILSLDPSSISFSDLSSNNAIDAGEQACLKFELSNKGYSKACDCVVRVSLSGATKGISVPEVKLPDIEIGKKVLVELPISAGTDTENGMVKFLIRVDDPNGYGMDPVPVEIATKAFVAPKLKVTDYAVSGDSGTLRRKTPFNLELLVQNVEYGRAQDVSMSVSFPAGVFVISGQQDRSFASMGPGESQSMEFSLIVSDSYSKNTVPVKVSLKEKYGKFAEDRLIELVLEQNIPTNSIRIAEKASAAPSAITLASLRSDVDKVPETGLVSDRTFAVIIANENYQNDASVDYARNDGTVFKEYCIKTLGIPSDNIRINLDATLNQMRNSISWIQSVAKAWRGEARIIFYYAGHGLPDDATRSAYILPVDGDGRNPASTGYSLENLYRSLSAQETESTVVFMDACFSGARRDGGMLTSARGVALNPKEQDPYGNLVVMSAASGEQTAYKYDAQKHGMFTYFLLKSLKENNGRVNLGQLSDYVCDNVSRRSIVVNSKSQTPTVTTGASVASRWREIIL